MFVEQFKSTKIKTSSYYVRIVYIGVYVLEAIMSSRNFITTQLGILKKYSMPTFDLKYFENPNIILEVCVFLLFKYQYLTSNMIYIKMTYDDIMKIIILF